MAGCFGSWFVFHVLGPQLVPGPATAISWPTWLLYGLILTGAGMFGDLAVSLLKREAARKDSGSALPGRGGILDLLDSLLFAAPVAYIFWVTRIVGP